jgi:ABC-type antimicrobial peptide transport system permease subunit
VGVARDSRYGTLDEPLPPFVYTPLAPRGSKARTLFVRGRGGLPPADLIARETQAIDPVVPPPLSTALANEMRIVLLPQRVAAMVTGMLGGFGLVLAAVGLYGLVAYTVTLRTREIGVRMALGADAPAVVRTMVSSGVRLVAAGSLVGLAASLLAVRLVQSYLLSVSAFDPAAFAGATILLGGVTLLATYLPARRAARVSPIEALSRDDQ